MGARAERLRVRSGRIALQDRVEQGLHEATVSVGNLRDRYYPLVTDVAGGPVQVLHFD
jgi:hypothetical protein